LVPADLFDDAPRIPIEPDLSSLPLTSDQEDCQRVGGIARLDSENFDGRSFPSR
ncbi:MAG: hypothetical protein GWO22_14205, partial [Actinobacteria bacterium]|nr:hypothetical protein [Actinomycetota bacterium]